MPTFTSLGGDGARCVKIIANVLMIQALEPHKCASWEWVPWKQMWEWSKQQAEAEREGRVVERRMFRPLVNLYLSYPELENCLDGR